MNPAPVFYSTYVLVLAQVISHFLEHFPLKNYQIRRNSKLFFCSFNKQEAEKKRQAMMQAQKEKQQASGSGGGGGTKKSDSGVSE